MRFPRVNATFYDAVNMIHDVITTANPFPYIHISTNSCLSVLKIIKFNKSNVER